MAVKLYLVAVVESVWLAIMFYKVFRKNCNQSTKLPVETKLYMLHESKSDVHFNVYIL